MATTRKNFLAAAASVPLLGAAPSPKPEPQVTATPKQPQISAAASALAERMKQFDPSLSDKQIEDIAEGIDGNLGVGKRVNPHGTFLKNWDEPVTAFEVPSNE